METKEIYALAEKCSNKAVDMVMERLEALKNDSTTD